MVQSCYKNSRRWLPWRRVGHLYSCQKGRVRRETSWMTPGVNLIQNPLTRANPAPWPEEPESFLSWDEAVKSREEEEEEEGETQSSFRSAQRTETRSKRPTLQTYATTRDVSRAARLLSPAGWKHFSSCSGTWKTSERVFRPPQNLGPNWCSAEIKTTLIYFLPF